jgi:transcription elongation factor/antiterminator RfaH
LLTIADNLRADFILTAIWGMARAVNAFQNSPRFDAAASGSARAWYAVNIRPQCESKAVLHLRRQEFETFLPVQLKTVRHARQYRSVCRPLFPGYLFVALDLARDRWRSVNGTHGVVSLVMNGGEPAKVPAGIVENLIAIASDRGVVRFDHQLEAGQRVKILTGPFADFVGILEQLDDQGRVKVLLEMMGQQIPIMSRARELMPA